MKRSLKFYEENIPVNEFNIIFASEKKINSWIDNNENIKDMVIFNEKLEQFSQKSHFDLFEIIKSLYDHFEFYPSIGQMMKSIDGMNNIIHITSLIKNLKENDEELQGHKSNQAENKKSNETKTKMYLDEIRKILKKVKKALENRQIKDDPVEIEKINQIKKNLRYQIGQLYKNSMETLAFIERNTDFYNSQNETFYANSIQPISDFNEITTQFNRFLADFNELEDDLSDIPYLKEMRNEFENYNNKILNIMKEEAKSGTQNKEEGHPTIEGVPGLYKVSKFDETLSEINYLTAEEHTDTNDQFDSITQRMSLVVKYIESIFNKVQMNYKIILNKFIKPEFTNSEIDDQSEFIDLVNEPFANAEKLEEHLSVLAKYEIFVRSVQKYSDSICKMEYEFSKTMDMLKTIYDNVVLIDSSYQDLEEEKDTIINQFDALTKNDDSIIKNEEQILAFVQNHMNIPELRHAFKKYNEQLAMIAMDAEKISDLENTINNSVEEITNINIGHSSLSDDYCYECFKEFQRFLSWIKSIADYTLNDPDILIEISLDIEKSGKSLLPIAELVVYENRDGKWDQIERLSNNLKINAVKEVILCAVFLFFASTVQDDEKWFAYELHQNPYFTAGLQERFFSFPDINDMGKNVIFFCNLNKRININNNKIKIIEDEEESE